MVLLKSYQIKHQVLISKSFFKSGNNCRNLVKSWGTTWWLLVQTFCPSHNAARLLQLEDSYHRAQQWLMVLPQRTWHCREMSSSCFIDQAALNQVVLPTFQHKWWVHLHVKWETVVISPSVTLSAATANTSTSCFTPGVKPVICCFVSFVAAVPLLFPLVHVTMNPELIPIGLIQEREIEDVVLSVIVRFWIFSGSVRMREREKIQDSNILFVTLHGSEMLVWHNLTWLCTIKKVLMKNLKSGTLNISFTKVQNLKKIFIKWQVQIMVLEVLCSTIEE